MPAEESPTTRELRIDQLRRAADERTGAGTAADADERAAHERRADKAAYLTERLAEREASEREEES